MLRWKLHVEDYGKISSADIEMAPMTLFVGDNNSGKSYLLSLLWGIHNLENNQWLSMEEGLQTEELEALKSWMREQLLMVREKKIHEVAIGEAANLLEAVLNQILAQQRLFLFIERRLLLKKAVIDPASVGTQVADDRHAVHVASKDERPFVYSQAKVVGNSILDNAAAHSQNVSDRFHGEAAVFSAAYVITPYKQNALKCACVTTEA